MHRLRTRLAAVLVAGALVLSLAVPLGLVQAVDEGEDGDTSVDITVVAPDDLEPNESATATVLVEGATEGISAYDLTLSLEGEAATIGDVEVLAEGDSGPMTNIDHTDDEVTVGAALLEATHEPASEIEILEIELEGETDGSATLAVSDVTELTDADVDRYAIRTTGSATVQVGDGDDGGNGIGAPAPDDGDVSDDSVDPDPDSDPELDLGLEVQDVTDGEAGLAVTAVNPADEPLERTLTLDRDGDRVGTHDLALEPDETAVVESTVSIPADAAGTITVSATTGDATAEAGIEIETEAESEAEGPIDFDAVQFPTEAAPGAQVTAEVAVANTGSEPRTESLTYAVADTQTTADVTVAPDETETVTLEVTVPEDATGSLEQTVAMGDDDRASELVVEGTDDESMPGYGATAALLALALVAGAIRFGSGAR